jgi:hypothetical protein
VPNVAEENKEQDKWPKVNQPGAATEYTIRL